MKKLFKLVVFLIIIIALIKYTPMAIEYFFPRSYNSHVETCAQKYNVDKNLIYAIIKAESNFRADAVSHKGAKGLMQITDDTAQWCFKELKIKNCDITNVGTNIEIGTYYLSYLLKKCGGNEKNAVAAYNAGHGNVEKWLSDSSLSSDGKTLSDIPFEETKQYVKKVELYKKIYSWENR